eukprot:NODE_3985_length_505_cov_89.401316_g3398_i0.p2 GENE.NODE_3985_length_505_cov_89.401316_g3398_i0~~NODE_3985_length_505_cov_89.401316_g3398_i0.p2  ORF type:complete len:56 (+),score=1.00 NODE_3985_length_505_cov_89.401316_g3398_i0:248-415(+)
MKFFSPPSLYLYLCISISGVLGVWMLQAFAWQCNATMVPPFAFKPFLLFMPWLQF